MLHIAPVNFSYASECCAHLSFPSCIVLVCKVNRTYNVHACVHTFSFSIHITCTVTLRITHLFIMQFSSQEAFWERKKQKRKNCYLVTYCPAEPEAMHLTMMPIKNYIMLHKNMLNFSPFGFVLLLFRC